MHSELELGYSFRNPSLLENALCHSSFANEHRGKKDNERLEFLGDAVLELCASHYLFDAFPHTPEGELSRYRAALVCEASLAAAARKLKLGEYLCLGKGEEKSGGRERDSILSDAYEAVLGAIYLDGGLKAARGFLKEQLLFQSESIPAQAPIDAKTRLQEFLQKNGSIQIQYRIVEEPSDNTEAFTAQVVVENEVLGTGRGHNKKTAEQAAAAAALTRLNALN